MAGGRGRCGRSTAGGQFEPARRIEPPGALFPGVAISWSFPASVQYFVTLQHSCIVFTHSISHSNIRWLLALFVLHQVMPRENVNIEFIFEDYQAFL